MALSSFIVCIARDPGPISALKAREEDVEREALAPQPQSRNEDQMSLAEALAGPSIGDSESSDEDSDIEVDDQGERRWCRKCWAPKVRILTIHDFGECLHVTRSLNERIIVHIASAAY